ncbi:hypothetical protein ScPMuIL_014940 [Solemya velum]
MTSTNVKYCITSREYSSTGPLCIYAYRSEMFVLLCVALLAISSMSSADWPYFRGGSMSFKMLKDPTSPSSWKVPMRHMHPPCKLTSTRRRKVKSHNQLSPAEEELIVEFLEASPPNLQQGYRMYEYRTQKLGPYPKLVEPVSSVKAAIEAGNGDMNAAKQVWAEHHVGEEDTEVTPSLSMTFTVRKGKRHAEDELFLDTAEESSGFERHHQEPDHPAARNRKAGIC